MTRKLLLLLTLDIIYSFLCYHLFKNTDLFSTKSDYWLIIFVSFLSLPFIILQIIENRTIGLPKKVWFVSSEFLLSTIIILYFFPNSFFSNGNLIFILTSIFIASFIGGLLTLFNYSFVSNAKYEIKKYLLYNFLISACIVIINFLNVQYSNSFLQLVGWWTYLSFSPEILSVIIWHLFNYKFLSQKSIRENNKAHEISKAKDREALTKLIVHTREYEQHTKHHFTD